MTDHAPASAPSGAPLPGDIELASGRLIVTRWVAGAMVLALTLFCVRVLGLPLPERGLLITGAAILAYNALLAWRAPHPRHAGDARARLRRFIVLQVALDWISMSVFLHLTGGITSPGIPLFLIHMLMVTILLRGRSPYIYLALGCVALGAIGVSESLGLLPHYRVIPALPPALHTDPTYLVAQVAFFAIAAFATVHLAALLMGRLRERERQVAALLKSSQAVSSTLSLETVLQHLATSAARALSTDRASIRLLDETGERLPMAASWGLSKAYRDKGQVELSRSPLDREAIAGRAVVIEHAQTDARIQYPREVAAEGIGSILVVPIPGRSGPLGVLRVYASQPGRFRSEDIGFAMAIASQGAVAIENAMAHEALQHSEQARALFVRTVTHELRAPVSGAQSLLRVLLRGLAGELTRQQRDIIGRVGARLDALMELIQDLLALAASRTVELQAQPEPVALQPALRQIVEQFAHEAGEKGLRLRLEAPEQPLSVRATPEGLAQIFGNLVGNAVKYTPAGGSVDVRLKRQDRSAVITIADTGIGIPADELTRLWDEFFRASNARRAEIVGTGLGLTIVKRLVETFSGLIGVQSEEGKGTIFTVSLPLLGAQN